MIYIHPTATHKLTSLVALKLATGMTISHGRRYLCLVPDNGDSNSSSRTLREDPRRAGKTTRMARYWPGPTHPGGGSAA